MFWKRKSGQAQDLHGKEKFDARRIFEEHIMKSESIPSDKKSELEIKIGVSGSEKRIITVLKDALESEDESVRYGAVCALGEVGNGLNDRRMYKTIQPLLCDHSKKVNEKAFEIYCDLSRFRVTPVRLAMYRVEQRLKIMDRVAENLGKKLFDSMKEQTARLTGVEGSVEDHDRRIGETERKIKQMEREIKSGKIIPADADLIRKDVLASSDSRISLLAKNLGDKIEEEFGKIRRYRNYIYAGTGIAAVSLIIAVISIRSSRIAEQNIANFNAQLQSQISSVRKEMKKDVGVAQDDAKQAMKTAAGLNRKIADVNKKIDIVVDGNRRLKEELNGKIEVLEKDTDENMNALLEVLLKRTKDMGQKTETDIDDADIMELAIPDDTGARSIDKEIPASERISAADVLSGFNDVAGRMEELQKTAVIKDRKAADQFDRCKNEFWSVEIGKFDEESAYKVRLILYEAAEMARQGDLRYSRELLDEAMSYSGSLLQMQP